MNRQRKKRWDTPAYRDGVTRAYLQVAEEALLKLGHGPGPLPENEHIVEAFSHVLSAKKIVQTRVESRSD